MAGLTAVTAAETKPRMRACREAVRELRASERALCGLHRFDRGLHALWAKLPLRLLRVMAASALIVGAAYLVLSRRQTIGHALTDLGSARPGYVAIAVAAELASLACYAALVGLLLRRGAVSVPFRALVSLTVVGIAMLNSLPGGQALSTIYWYQQLRRYHVQRSVAVFALLASTLLGIVTLVLLAAGGLALGGHGFAAGARVPVVATAGLLLLLAMLALGFLNWLFDLIVWYWPWQRSARRSPFAASSSPTCLDSSCPRSRSSPAAAAASRRRPRQDSSSPAERQRPPWPLCSSTASSVPGAWCPSAGHYG
jgi:hypothetical protein